MRRNGVYLFEDRFHHVNAFIVGDGVLVVKEVGGTENTVPCPAVGGTTSSQRTAEMIFWVIQVKKARIAVTVGFSFLR